MKMVTLFRSILFILLLLTFNNVYSKTIYVATDGDGTDGSSWATAYIHIQTAITAATSGDVIWVKEGVYYADPAAPAAETDRSLSIILKSGVKLYGGFTADEVTIDDRPKSDIDGDGIIQDWEYSSPTVLSGEIQDDGLQTNNTQHIFIVPDGADASTLVDGFTIEDGYSDVQSSVSGVGTYTFASGVIMSGGEIFGCIVQNCESNSVYDGYAGGILAYNSSVQGCYIDGCVITGKGTYGGGIYLDASEMKGTVIKNSGLVASESSGLAIGGGVYSTGAIIDSCYIYGCNANPESNFKGFGGGMYNVGSQIIDCIVADNKTDGLNGHGGGVYGLSSTYINTIIFNNEASAYAGGAYALQSYFTNCVVTKNKTVDTNAIGGGAYGDTESTFYNTVFWGNQTSGTSPQLKVVDGGDIINCAIEEVELGTNGISISSSNSGSEVDVLYPQFISPTSFIGNTNGNTSYEDELYLADWNIAFSSDLIEKGDNNGFYEAYVSKDLDGDGSNTKTIVQFLDLADEYRLFNKAVDIGAYEPAFIDLTLPDAMNMEYGLSLGEIDIDGGSATDLRDGVTIPGVYSFTDAATVPQYNDGVSEKFRVVFTPEDLDAYVEVYDSIYVTITAKELTMSGLTADDKEYDGTTTVTFSGTAVLDGIVGTDDVSLIQAAIDAAFEDKNVGVDKNVVFSGFDLSGVDAGNYTLSANGALATITSKPVEVSTLTAVDRVYDGTVDATYTGTLDVVGKIDGDDVIVDAGSGAALFDTKVVDVDKVVSFSGFALTGVDADNYTLSQPVDSKATISPLSVIVEGISAANKVYDSSVDATIEGTAVVNTIISGDDVSLNIVSASASFDTKDIGANKTVTLGGYFIMGADASNYSLSQPDVVTADITAKELTITGLSAQDKQYDGTTSVTLSGTAVLEGIEGADDVSLNTTLASSVFTDANVGTAKEVSVTGLSLSGVDQSNYTLTIPALSANITAVEIVIVADDKTMNYNDTDPVLTYAVTSGSLVGSDEFVGGLEREAGDNAGTYIISQGTLSLTSNYNISFTPGVFTINKAANTIDFGLETTSYYLSDTDQISLSATSTSGLTVSFSSSDENIASISGNTLIVNSFGNVTITASETGGANYDAATNVTVDIKIAVKVIQKSANMLLVSNIKNAFTSYQWYNNSGAISGATNQYYYSSTALSGDYYCKLNGSFDSDIWTGGAVAAAMDVYPSPALKGSTLTVEFKDVDDSSLENSTVKIYSITGKLIKQLSDVGTLNQIQLAEPGIYIIKTEGTVQTVKKIIVK